jgi:hypothetical protein
VAHSLTEGLAIGSGLSYLSFGEIEGYDINGNATGEIGATYNLAAGISVGYCPASQYSVGLTVKYISISLAGTGASAVAIDLGARYSSEKFGAGLTLANLGQNIKFDTEDTKLPAAIRAGVYYYPISSFVATTEIEKQFYGDVAFKNGFEYRYDNYFLRTGYVFHPEQNSSNLSSGLSFGVGAIFGNFQFDYTFTPDNRVSSYDMHRISLIIDLPR